MEQHQGATQSLSALPAGPKLNLGCGPVQPAGWINIDGSHRAWLAARLPWLDRLLTGVGLLGPTEFGPHVQVADLRREMPFASNSVACIYAGELWEHFVPGDALRLTAECHRVLVAGGVLRVCVPDGAVFWRKYLDLYEEEMGRSHEMRSGPELSRHVAMFFNDICTRKRLLASMGHFHKWQYDELQLVDLFKEGGFQKVERLPFHVSRITDVANVERSAYLIVEGVKA